MFWRAGRGDKKQRLWTSCGVELVKQEKGICFPASPALREGWCPRGSVFLSAFLFWLMRELRERSGLFAVADLPRV